MKLIKRLLAALLQGRTTKPALGIVELDGVSVDLSQATKAELVALTPKLLHRQQELIKAVEANGKRQTEIAQQKLGIATDLQLIEAQIDFETWAITLKQQFGQEVGEKLIRQEIEPGMSLAHLYMSFGFEFTAGSVGEGESELLTFTYGNRRTGAYFEVNKAGIITMAEIVAPPLPPVRYSEEIERWASRID
jgi:hypothetical protein